ncbi:hypothetical protein ACK3TF_001899 [Chlorella vulgaris]
MMPPFTELCMEEPQLFHLGSSGLDELADGRIKHGKVVLPFHSQILAAQSSVLRDLLKTPFKDFALAEVVYFLRLIYRTTDATAANLKCAAAYAPGIIRLAHSLDLWMIKWLPVTETCGLKRAWSFGIRRVQPLAAARLTHQLAFACRALAVDMATGTSGSHAAHVAVQKLLTTLSQDSFAAVLAVVAAACRKTSTVSAGDVPDADLLAHWKAANLQPGDGEYVVVSTKIRIQQPAMESSSFEAVGYKWQLSVRLEGHDVWLHLKACTPTAFHMAYELDVINQLDGTVYAEPSRRRTSPTPSSGFMFSRCIGHDLRNTPGYVVDDAIKVRVRISVVEE